MSFTVRDVGSASLFLLIFVGASKGFENVDTGWGLGDDRVNVGIEDEMGIESNSKYAVSSFLR